RRPSEAGRDVSGEDADPALAARDRPPLRRARPHHRAARRAQDRGTGRQGHRAVRRGRVAEAAIAGSELARNSAPLPPPLVRRSPRSGEGGCKGEGEEIERAPNRGETGRLSLESAPYPRHLTLPQKPACRTLRGQSAAADA